MHISIFQSFNLHQFQNRRSRAKKEGKVLKKLPSHEEPNISFEMLEKQMGNWIVPEHERVEPADSDVSEYEWEYDSDEEDNVSSPYILSTISVQPPSCSLPGPQDIHATLIFQTYWMRHRRHMHSLLPIHLLAGMNLSQ